MKRVILMAFAAAMICGCEKMVLDEETGAETQEKTKMFTFTMKGDFENQTFTRGYLSDADNLLTDLWVFDFVDGECVQSLHQTDDATNWGEPSMSLTYGTHHVYFVASRGLDPQLDEEDTSITFSSVRDSYWKDYEVTVFSTSNGNRAVTLDRVVTKLKITAEDEVPAGTARLIITPATWYYGINYTTGEPTDARSNVERPISVPSSYAGTEGQLSASIFSFSSANQWTTNVSVVAKNDHDVTIGEVAISNAPFKRNRATEYSGSLFGTSGSMTVAVNEDWLTPYTGTW